MTLIRVDRWDVRRDGALSEAALQRKIEALGFDVRARIYPAGTADFPTIDETVCLMGIVRGLIKLSVDGDPAFLTGGDLAYVPAGARRSVEVMGPLAAFCLEAFPRTQQRQARRVFVQPMLAWRV